MVDPPAITGSPATSATIPIPATAGDYALKIQVNYTGGQTAYWPDPAGTLYFGLHVVSVVPLVVNATVSPASSPVGQNVTFSCSATGGLQPYFYQWRSPLSFIIPGATQPTWQTTSPSAGNVVAYCYVTDSQPTPVTSSDSATATFTGSSPVSVNVQASTNNTTVGNTVYFTCSASGGGGGPFNYTWSGNAVSGTGPNASQTFTSAGTYNAVCTAVDSVTGGAGIGSTSVVVTGGGGGALSVNVTASPNPGTVNQNVTFSCNASGGAGGYTYQWRSPATSFTIPGATSSTFTTSSPVVGNISAGCTVTDIAGATATNSTAVQIIDLTPAAACVDVNYSILDRDNGFIPIPPSSNFLGQYFAVATGQKLAFLATGTGLGSLDWDFGDTIGTGSGNPIWYTYATAGTFYAKVTANANSTCAKSYLFLVAGPSGLFTARYADNTIFSSTRVDSGKDLKFAATDTADSYAWNFGDGFTSLERNPTHAFRVNGSSNVTFTTTLTVTIGANHWSTSQNFTVIPPPEPPKWFVAGLAYTQGAAPGTVWQSDLTILNPHPALSATYSLAFLDGRNPVAPGDLVWQTITLGKEQSISGSNVVGAFFGKPLGSYGAIIVRGDVAPVAPVITSRTYNNGNPGSGTFGLSVPVAQATSGVSPQSSTAQQLLIGLRDDGSAYTNIGLVNLISTDWSHAHLTFFDGAGANLGVLNVDVPPYGVTQLSRPLTNAGWLGKPPLALYRVQVTVEPGGAVYPYATVIDQTSTDPIVVTPTEQPLNAYRIPGIVRLAGANNTVWRSRFVLHNPSTSARQVSVLYSYVPCDATGCGGRQLSSGPGDISMAPGETKTWDDFPAAWLTAVPGGSVSDNVSYGSSYIDVAPASGDTNQDPLLVLGETFNSQPAGPVGLQLSGFTDLDGGSKTGAGKRLLLTGLASNDDFRTNVAFFLTSGTRGSFNLRVLSDTGVTLKSFGWDLTGSSPFKQFSDTDLFGGVNKSDRMSIIVDSFDGSPVAAYATIIDNRSGDATFVKAQPAP
ncbi:MAG: PKD domain-containing protein [Thermoanaerobaculia bacterium]|nr:PKD domain-containing protein [Thermoanaerobaculia bacterium]